MIIRSLSEVLIYLLRYHLFLSKIDQKGKVKIVSTNITKNIVKILLREGFIENVRKHQESQKNFLVSTLRHRKTSKGNKINLKRISRPGLRIYSNYQRIPKILGGMGIVILSTSRGIMTDRSVFYLRFKRTFLAMQLTKRARLYNQY